MPQDKEENHGIALPEGFELGNYTIRRVIGQGEFGITYLAYDSSLDTEVVLKENMPVTFAGRSSESHRVYSLSKSSDDFDWAKERFIQGARTLSKLNHRHIVRVMRVFEALGTAYFVMPYVGVRSLDKMLQKDDSFTEEKLLPLLKSLLSALSYLHSKEILHRDIKPANILLDDENEPVLIDFGTARPLSQHSQTVVESPGYTPLEQMRTHGNVGPWTDLYALGGTMYKLITGKPPVRCLDRVEEDSQPRLSDNPDLLKNYSRRLRESIDRALALKVCNRWQSAREWMELLTESEPTPGQQHDGNSVISFAAPERQGKEPMKDTLKGISRKGKTVLISLLFGGLVALSVCCAYLLNGSLQNQVGDMYRDGRYFTQNTAKAADWYRRAAECGHADEQNKLGVMYREGRGVTKDDAQAVAWFRKAAEQGNADAQNNLGWMYAKGRGVAQDDAQAVAWFRKAAEQGLAEAQNSLGDMYQEGRGVAQDDAQAVAWFRKAAEQGHADAQNNLGWMYKEGRGVAQDDAQAVAWFRKAAEQGFAAAQNNLGWMYQDGRGVPKDDAQAVAWYRKAAEQGHADAQDNLGDMYYAGRGVPKNRSEAIKWYRKAAKQGNKYAKESLRRLGVKP